MEDADKNIGNILIRLWDGTRHLLAGPPERPFLVTIENTFHNARGHEQTPSPQEQAPGLVVVEPDIDYYKDETAHTILEVIPNKVHQTLTDPEQVYVLHWIASKMAGLDCAPPYVIDVA